MDLLPLAYEDTLIYILVNHETFFSSQFRYVLLSAMCYNLEGVQFSIGLDQIFPGDVIFCLSILSCSR